MAGVMQKAATYTIAAVDAEDGRELLYWEEYTFG